MAAAAVKRPPPWKAAKGSSTPASGGGAGTKKKAVRKRKWVPLPPLLAPGTAVEVLRNGAWVGGGTVTIRNDRAYMVSLDRGSMTVVLTRARVRPAAAAVVPAAAGDGQ
ncbi:hypothetical protein BRADI_2g36016v3 [Brachypodium distachyon]|uniref:Uncharacterized protein n=1 Tax=Brachypodium distachyon TaxID=15368 RepID=A0A0Q3K9E5_BRADI|nr:hypothetical protein BRADI_2g36016v3 [Brachypodium distachyon]